MMENMIKEIFPNYLNKFINITFFELLKIFLFVISFVSINLSIIFNGPKITGEIIFLFFIINTFSMLSIFGSSISIPIKLNINNKDRHNNLNIIFRNFLILFFSSLIISLIFGYLINFTLVIFLGIFSLGVLQILGAISRIQKKFSLYLLSTSQPIFAILLTMNILINAPISIEVICIEIFVISTIFSFIIFFSNMIFFNENNFVSFINFLPKKNEYYLYLESLLTYFSKNIDIYLIGSFASFELLSIFRLATQIYNLLRFPIASVNIEFYERLAKDYNKGFNYIRNIYLPLYLKYSLKYFLVSIFISVYYFIAYEINFFVFFIIYFIFIFDLFFGPINNFLQFNKKNKIILSSLFLIIFIKLFNTLLLHYSLISEFTYINVMILCFFFYPFTIYFMHMFHDRVFNEK